MLLYVLLWSWNHRGREDAKEREIPLVVSQDDETTFFCVCVSVCVFVCDAVL